MRGCYPKETGVREKEKMMERRESRFKVLHYQSVTASLENKAGC